MFSMIQLRANNDGCTYEERRGLWQGQGWHDRPPVGREEGESEGLWAVPRLAEAELADAGVQVQGHRSAPHAGGLDGGAPSGTLRQTTLGLRGWPPALTPAPAQDHIVPRLFFGTLAEEHVLGPGHNTGIYSPCSPSTMTKRTQINARLPEITLQRAPATRASWNS